jgi:CubicO group peptidase (beta-lactamase class C family)
MAPKIIKKKQDFFNDYLAEAVAEFGLPGIVAGVWIRAGSLEYIKAAGRLDIKGSPPLRTDDIFHMASVSKLIVSMAVMQLAERGRLDLDEPIAKYLPWLVLDDNAQERITPQRLLAHISGLPDVVDYGWDRPKTGIEALRDYLSSEEVRSAALLWPPEAGRFQYSNLGYEILGAVISAVSRQSFERYMDENIFIPLFMNDSSYMTFRRSARGKQLDEETEDKKLIAEALSVDALVKEAVAAPHVKDENGDVVMLRQYPYNREHAPSSTLTSNLEDMRKWGDAVLRKELLSAESYAAAMKPIVAITDSNERMGLGWFIREQNGYTLYGHEGMDDGFRSSFWLCPEIHGKFMVMSNVSDAPVKKICNRLFEIAIG